MLQRTDAYALGLVGGVLILLATGTAVGQLLTRRAGSGLDPSLIRAFNLRVRAWWLMWSVLAAAFLIGETATVVVFGAISFWALREFITLTPTRPGDHRALFWVFFLFTPLQFVLVGIGYSQYGLYSILIPVYAFLFIPARIAISGDYERFLERAAKIQAGLIICVYCFSYAPALLTLTIPDTDYDTQLLLFFFVVIVQFGDLAQFVWGRLLGRHVIASNINASRTWEGLAGGTLTTMVVGALLWWATPFEQPFLAAAVSGVSTVMGCAGAMTMSAIKRDRGVKDYGEFIVGHGGVLDRIDSLCFAAPVFFHLTRFFCL
ncbi:MAG: phosphatidate cytidylyltransferase [Pirellulales bacterium]|nr:phosphatidate cytidylyltransferase [Planctomycetales bacterium]